MRTLACLAGAFVALTLCGCSGEDAPPPREEGSGTITLEDLKQKARETFDMTVAFSRQKADEWKARYETRRQELETQIEQLKAEGEQLREEAREEWQRRLTELETKRERVEKLIQQLGAATETAWDTLKQEAKAAWEETEPHKDKDKSDTGASDNGG